MNSPPSKLVENNFLPFSLNKNVCRDEDMMIDNFTQIYSVYIIYIYIYTHYTNYPLITLSIMQICISIELINKWSNF